MYYRKEFYFGHAAIVGDHDTVVYNNVCSAPDSYILEEYLQFIRYDEVGEDEEIRPLMVFDPYGVMMMLNGEINGQEFFDKYHIADFDFNENKLLWNYRNEIVANDEEFRKTFWHNFFELHSIEL